VFKVQALTKVIVLTPSSNTVLLSGIGKAKQANEPMTHGIGKLWAIYKKFGPLG